MKKVFILACIIALLGCQDIREKPFTKENQIELYTELRSKLTDQEKKDLEHYIESERFAIAESGENPPQNDYEFIKIGHTFKDVMLELKKIKEDEKEQNRLATLYTQYQNELQNAVTLKPTKKWVDENGDLIISFQVKNNTDKPIKAYQGTYFFNDVFDESLLNAEIKMELKPPLKAGMEGTITNGRPYDPSLDKFISHEIIDMKKQQMNDKIIFLDGSSLPKPIKPVK